MAKFVVAGKADCPYYARAELLADTLACNLPDFKVHKIVLSQSEWPSWVQDCCRDNNWTHPSNSSPLIWRELLDRGGKGYYMGGVAQFEDYAKHYYNIVPSTTSTLEHQIACENLDTFQTLQLAELQNRPPEPIHVCITNASCPLAYQLAPRLLIDQVFGNNKIHLHLYDTAPNLPFLEGVAMELQDMAHPSLSCITCTDSISSALTAASAVFLLDYYGTKRDIAILNTDDTEAIEKALRGPAHHYNHYVPHLDLSAHKDVRVMAVGPYSNMAAGLLAHRVSSIAETNFISSSVLLEHQTQSILAQKLGVSSADVFQVGVWGYSEGATLTDVSQTRVCNFKGSITGPKGFSLPLTSCLFDRKWISDTLPALITSHLTEASSHGNHLSSAITLAKLAKGWWNGEGPWYSVGVVEEGKRVAVSRPCTCEAGVWKKKDIELGESAKVCLEELEQKLSLELKIALKCTDVQVGGANEETTPTSKL